MVRLYVLTGFLGSGKTSVINSLLGHLTEQRVGLIVNDFGPIVVDSALVASPDSVVVTKSLGGGQIFCSCLSGKFVDSVEAMLPLGPDMIIVEASGLAKPAPLLEIVSTIVQRSAGQVVYGGMVCVIDAQRYHMIVQSFKSLEEQVVFSDGCIVNKADLVDSKTLDQVVGSITRLRPLAPVFTTIGGEVRSEMLPLWQQPVSLESKRSIDAASYAGWGLEGRPKTLLFTIEGQFSETMLRGFLTSISSSMLRIKGFVPVGGGKAYLVDVVGPHVRLGSCGMPTAVGEGVVCIHRASLHAESLVKREWERHSDGSSRLKLLS